VTASTPAAAPRRFPESAGLLLALALGVGSMALGRALSVHWPVPDVLLALLLGGLVVNTPLGRLVGLPRGDVGPGKFGPGLTFVGKTLLRGAVVLMGLRIQAHFFEAPHLATVALGILAAIPTTFFLTHALAVPLRVPRALADLVAAGTMICGASAVNAVAPVIGARKHDQAIALATVFLFSAIAMVTFRGVAIAMGLSPLDGGIWSGLSVNDLASAVAVGAQMGPGGAEMAAASKSARIVMLAPMLVMFALLRADPSERAQSGGFVRAAVKHLPPFVAGFVVLAVFRAIGDSLWGAAAAWHTALTLDGQLVALAMTMVAASIGLHLRVGYVLASGLRAATLGAVAATSTAGLTLALLMLALRGAYGAMLAVALTAVTGSFVAYHFATYSRRAALDSEALLRRHRATTGAMLSLSDPLTRSGAVHAGGGTGEFPVPS
jgi:uncharacterized integral membrane protein (TIGR00698 family)